jgi:hypothetical protein
MQKKLHTNALVHESSPYLLQHAHNPVDWHPWGPEALEKAVREDKLLLVSIGYAACHWCHVMEKESFEDDEVAEVMNEHFICVKVDREERPDVDHYFMTAVQLTGAQGGWPLNVVALPDGKPLWGGTYFPKENWMYALRELNRLYHEKRDDTVSHAGNLAHGIQQVSLKVERGAEAPVTQELIRNAVEKWKYHFDLTHGGRRGQPKFPMPVNLEFLIHFAHTSADQEVMDFVMLTLRKMAMGGIYDQPGGGFARYSVDEIWKVPHFEKMLYDNAQLLSVYAKAWQVSGDPLFGQVIRETTGWLEREMTHPDGAFYSSLDADSEGVEGKFYTWKASELKQVIGAEYPVFAEYFNINELGYWEEDRYILLRTRDHQEFAAIAGITEAELAVRVAGWKSRLLQEREKRVRPGLDDKTLTSWNALMIQGLCDAAKATGESHFREMALKNGEFLRNNLMTSDGSLFHNWKNGKPSVDGFLEDYALLTQAFISLFAITGEESWIKSAHRLVIHTLEHFYDPEHNLFYFSRKDHHDITGNHYQTEDNVIASSNSVMALNLLRLSRIFSEPEWERLAAKMARNITSSFAAYPYAYANWGRFLLMLTGNTREVAVSGENALPVISGIQQKYLPDVIFAASTGDSSLPLLKNRYVAGKTQVYVCSNGSCRLPVETASEAMKLLAGI